MKYLKKFYIWLIFRRKYCFKHCLYKLDKNRISLYNKTPRYYCPDCLLESNQLREECGRKKDLKRMKRKEELLEWYKENF